MVYTPYDWNQAVQQRTEYIEERLREGSPVVGLSLPEGALLVSVHAAQRKIYEIYDRMMFGGIGNQSDVEMVRNAALDFAHREGFQRSPDDVTLQRLVSAALSPAIKRGFADPFTVPFVFRGLFAELGERPEEDRFYCLNYEGDFTLHPDYAVVAGTPEAENEMTRLLHDARAGAGSLESAVRLALEAWAVGRSRAGRRFAGEGEEGESEPAPDPGTVLREELGRGTFEAALLERNTPRESRFRLLDPERFDALLREYR